MKYIATTLLAGAMLAGTSLSGAMADESTEDTASVAAFMADKKFAFANGSQHDVILPGPDATEFEFKLKGYVLGLRMIKADYKGYIENGRYAVYSDLKTSGLAAMLKKLRIWAITQGRYDANGLRPDFHVQQNLDKKNRRVEMEYKNDQGLIDIEINPPIGSQGVPPASPEERFAADDTISALLHIMMRGYRVDGDVCSGGVKVFDSKQHYNLRMEHAGTKDYDKDDFDETVIRCNVFYEPINGFDPEDLPDPEEANTPVVVYLSNDNEHGFYIPIRFTYKISGFTAVIKVVDLKINGPVYQN